MGFEQSSGGACPAKIQSRRYRAMSRRDMGVLCHPGLFCDPPFCDSEPPRSERLESKWNDAAGSPSRSGRVGAGSDGEGKPNLDRSRCNTLLSLGGMQSAVVPPAREQSESYCPTGSHPSQNILPKGGAIGRRMFWIDD